MLDELAGGGLTAPVVVAAAGYGNNADFRAGIATRGARYIVQVDGDLSAHPAEATPELKPYSGRGRRPRPRYRTRPVGLRAHALAAGRAATVQITWRQGSRGSLTSHFLAVRVRPAGRNPTARLAADGSLLTAWLLAEWPPDAVEPTDYWLCDLPETTPLPELVRLAKIRWRVEHATASARPAWAWTTSRAAPSPAGTATSPWSPLHSSSSPCCATTQSGCAGVSLYAVLRELQALLATWTGTCTVCGQHVEARSRAPT
jgi:hypothetical protein